MSKLTYSQNLPVATKIVAKKYDSLTDEELAMTAHYHEQFDEPLATLVDIHTYCRPHNSITVDVFVDKFIMQKLAQYEPYTLNGINCLTQNPQPYAVVIEIGADSKTLFSAHVDTVHGYSGRQVVDFDADMGLLIKPTSARSQFGDCLGADDGAGVWLLIQMIEAEVPGVYVFHYGEEVGGVGSSGIADDHPEFLKRFERAVAFDRKGSTDVITHQGMGRCCSDKFARELADGLNNTGNKLSMAPDNGGIFTDTANYTHLIPECTNIACGYEGAHSSGEFLDVEYLMKLADACIQMDWENLPTCRDVKEVDPINDWGYGAYSFKSPRKVTPMTWGVEKDVDELMEMRFGEMIKWVKDSKPEDIAEVLFEMVDRIRAGEEALYDVQDELNSQYQDYMIDEDQDDTSHN